MSLINSLDSYDQKILRVLAQKGAIRNIEIAETVGLSASACHQRVSRLKKIGVIRGFVVDVDLARIGSFLRVLTLVMIENQDQVKFKVLNERLKDAPRVIRAYRTAGDFDYAFETLAPDFECYRLMLEELFKDLKIKQYQSRIMQEEIKAVPDANAIF